MILGTTEKVILRTIDDADFEWSMGASDSEIIFCSGEIFKGQEFAIDALESLSLVLRELGFPHIIWIDDENSYLIKEFKFDYEP